MLNSAGVAASIRSGCQKCFPSLQSYLGVLSMQTMQPPAKSNGTTNSVVGFADLLMLAYKRHNIPEPKTYVAENV